MATLTLSNLKRIQYPLLSISLLVLGNSYYTTLTTLQLHDRKIAPVLIGSVITAYFTGLIAGALMSRIAIHRYGHARTYFLTILLTCICAIAQSVFDNIFVWILTRFLVGTMLGMAIVVIESWIVSASDGAFRTRIFAVYTLIYYGMQSLSQLFFRIDGGRAILQYAIIIVFVAVAAVPVASARALPPIKGVLGRSRVRLADLNRFGLIASFFAGGLYATLYTVLPLYLSMKKQDDATIGGLMMAALFGGAILLYPISNWADKNEKSRSIAVISMVSVFLSFGLLVHPEYSWMFSSASFLLFGLAFSLYPISLSLTVEKLSAEEMIDGTSLVLFGFGLGAMICPSVATFLMQLFGPSSFVYFLAITGLVLCAAYYFLSNDARQMVQQVRH